MASLISSVQCNREIIKHPFLGGGGGGGGEGGSFTSNPLTFGSILFVSIKMEL